MMEFELTPVESRGGYLFKRDDLFMPYDFCRINGSKLRQCILLVDKNREKAAKGIITGTSVLSPQAAITSAVAKANGYPCSIYYGGTTPTALAKYDYPRLCAHLGADVRIVSRSGMTSVLNAIVSRRVEQTGELAIRYGFDLRNNLDVFITSVAQQCQNLPEHLDNLVMVVGSAITLIGVLCGISMYGKDVDRIVGVGCAPNRMAKIEAYAELVRDVLGVSLPLDKLKYVDAFNIYKGFKYEDTVTAKYYGLTFHPRYEAKAFKYMYNQIPPNQGRQTLFWINGQSI